MVTVIQITLGIYGAVWLGWILANALCKPKLHDLKLEDNDGSEG
jgi:hypothetical protein